MCTKLANGRDGGIGSEAKVGRAYPIGSSTALVCDELQRAPRYVSRLVNPLSRAYSAIWKREGKPNFESTLLIWVSTVRLLTTSCSAISALDLPCPIKAATSRSRSVRPPYCSAVALRGETGFSFGSVFRARSARIAHGDQGSRCSPPRWKSPARAEANACCASSRRLCF